MWSYVDGSRIQAWPVTPMVRWTQHFDFCSFARQFRDSTDNDDVIIYLHWTWRWLLTFFNSFLKKFLPFWQVDWQGKSFGGLASSWANIETLIQCWRRRTESGESSAARQSESQVALVDGPVLMPHVFVIHCRNLSASRNPAGLSNTCRSRRADWTKHMISVSTGDIPNLSLNTLQLLSCSTII